MQANMTIFNALIGRNCSLVMVHRRWQVKRVCCCPFKSVNHHVCQLGSEAKVRANLQIFHLQNATYFGRGLLPIYHYQFLNSIPASL